MSYKVMLINPSNTMPKDSVRRLAPPLGILYIASVLKDDHKVKILDSTCDGYFNTIIHGDYITYGLDENKIKQEIKSFRPDYIGISSMFSAHQDNALNHAKWAKEVDSSITTMMGGIHPSLFPEGTIKNENVDFVIIGEGEFRTKKLLEGDKSFNGLAYKDNGKIKINPMTTRIDDLNAIPFPARELIDFEKYIDIGVPYAPFPLKERTAQIQTSRGCPFNCLEGNTLINTLNGKIKIKDLVGKTDIKVLTRNPLTEEAEFTYATNIRKTRRNAELVRVHFDDDTYIDCTPDHRFLVIKNGNQYTSTKLLETEAQNLKKEQSVKAVRYEYNSVTESISIYWKGKEGKSEHRLVMEGMMERKLKRHEVVHHKDRNPSNNHPSNLECCASQREHFKKHPEISERMKRDNPQRFCTEESYRIIAKKNREKKRSIEQRERYRLSKLGSKNPNFGKHSIPWNKGKIGVYSEEEIQRRRENWLGTKNPRYNPNLHKEVNHRVLEVEFLPYKRDTYCMEVPGYHWFFANNVLVHNCVFCATVKYWGRHFRMRSVDNILSEIDQLIEKYNIQEIQFTDDNMTINKKRIIELLERLKKDYDIAWCPPHGLMANTLNEKMIKLMAESGAYQLTIAIESGSPRVRKEIVRKTVPPKEKVKLLIDTAHKYNVQVHGLFIIGFPGEKKDEMFMTVKYPYDVGFDSISFFVANPMPGSDLYDICKEKGYLVPNLKSNVKTAEINIPKDSPDYVMSNKLITKIADVETRRYNEFIRAKYPDIWDKKFKQFLKKHGDKADLLLGRVT